MSVKLAALQEELLTLSDGERQQLLLSLEYVGRRHDMTAKEMVVFEAIMQESERRITAVHLLQEYGARKYAARCEEVYEFIEETRRYLRQPQVRALILLCFKCLARELRARQIPVGPNTLLNNIGLIGHAVDRCFPGYAAAGILHRVAMAA